MITLDELHAICPLARTSKLAEYVEPLNTAMTEFGIDTPKRAMCFIPNVLHESGGFNYVHEIASGADYDGRQDLGNTKPEAIQIAQECGSTPGRWWRGHGPIQITGFDNHLACSLALFGDNRLLRTPQILERPLEGCRAAGWFWKTHSLSDYADKGDFDGVCDVINRGHKTARIGDANHYDDRLTYFKRAKALFA